MLALRQVCIEVHIILGVFWSLKPAQVARLTLTLRDAFGNPLQSAPFLRGPVESRVKVLAYLGSTELDVDDHRDGRGQRGKRVLLLFKFAGTVSYEQQS